MRHTRARRRFKFILSMLLAGCFILFLEEKIEAFVPQIKNFAATKIEDAFDGKYRLSIGSLGGGILHPIVLNDIKIKDKNETLLFPSLVIDSVRTNYRVWDVFLHRKDGGILTNLWPKDSYVYINFVTKNKDASGFLKVEGDLQDAAFKGYVNLLESERIDFAGRVKADSFEIEMRPPRGSVRAEGVMAEDGTLKVNAKIDHLKVSGFDIVCNVTLRNKIVNASDNPKDSYLEGEFETNNLILNYKPFLSVKASYKISGGVLRISNLDIGDTFKVRGEAVLRDPYNIDIGLLANNVSLGWLMSSLGAKDATSILSGTMNGKFDFKGPLKAPRLNAKFEIRKGMLSRLDFENLSATLKGDLPFVRIEDSRITRESGYFALAGEMDLRRIGKENLFDDIKMASDDKAITWDSWDSAKTQDAEEITMKKKLNDQIQLNFKKFISEEKVDESLRDTDEVQLEYKLHPHESLKMMVGQDKDFLGIEHKDRF